MNTRLDINIDSLEDRISKKRYSRRISIPLDSQWRILIHVLVIMDLFFTILGFVTAYFIRYFSSLPFFEYWIHPSIDYSKFSLLIVPVWIIIFAGSGLYSRNNLLGGTKEYSLVFNATTLGLFVIISAGFLLPDDLLLARGWVILSWGFTFLYLVSYRFFVRRIVYFLRNKGYLQSLALIIGANSEASLIAEQLVNTKSAGLRVLGFITTNDESTNKIGNLDAFGDIGILDSIIEQKRINVIILISSALTQEQILTIFRKYGTAKNLELRMTTGLYEIITTGLQVKHDGMVPLVVINKVRLTGSDQVMKTLLDYCLAIPTLIVLFPFFIIIAAAIKIDSPGPVIYLRRVMGMNGKQFNAFKFRTMIQNSAEFLTNNPDFMMEYKDKFKIKNDPRITRVGSFLRKWSLDEFPQFINVLLGQMSVVGPRMICPEELEKYNQWDINLLTVKPGLTGLWQVRGRSDVSYDERVRLDMFYVRNWTIWLDLQIIFQTLPSVIFRKGAY